MLPYSASGEDRVKVTTEPLRGANIVGGSVPILSVVTPDVLVVAVFGNETGIEAPQVFPLLPTWIPVSFVPSAEYVRTPVGWQVLSELAMHSLSEAHLWHLLDNLTIDKLLGDIVVLECCDWPVGQSSQFLSDSFYPYLYQ